MPRPIAPVPGGREGRRLRGRALCGNNGRGRGRGCRDGRNREGNGRGTSRCAERESEGMAGHALGDRQAKRGESSRRRVHGVHRAVVRTPHDVAAPDDIRDAHVVVAPAAVRASVTAVVGADDDEHPPQVVTTCNAREQRPYATVRVGDSTQVGFGHPSARVPVFVGL